MIAAGIIEPHQLVLQSHPREQDNPVREPDVFDRAAEQIEHVVAIGDLYRRDRFASPVDLWTAVTAAIPDLLETPQPHRYLTSQGTADG